MLLVLVAVVLRSFFLYNEYNRSEDRQMQAGQQMHLKEVRVCSRI